MMMLMLMLLMVMTVDRVLMWMIVVNSLMFVMVMMMMLAVMMMTMGVIWSDDGGVNDEHDEKLFGQWLCSPGHAPTGLFWLSSMCGPIPGNNPSIFC